MRRFIAAFALAIGVVCSNSSIVAPPGIQAAAPKTHIVTIRGYKFLPQHLMIRIGDRVTWINHDADQHTVTSDARTTVALRSRPLSGGTRYSITFPRAGTFYYHCGFHPFMMGAVTVQAHR